MTDPFDLYICYLALKRHFTSNYDYFKYNGKVSAKVSSFEKRKDRYFFTKLSKFRDPQRLLLANIVHNPDMWIGNIVDEAGKNIYTEWLKRQESLSYRFSTDLSKLEHPFDSNMGVTGSYPNLLTLYYNGEISLESITILAHLTKCLPYWSRRIEEPIIWPKTKLLLEKYHPFLVYDKAKIKKLVLSRFDC